MRKKNHMNVLQQFFTMIKPLIPIFSELKKNGARPYVVGGTVRDLFLQHDIKDLDIEVHNLSLESLEEILQTFGPVKLVGKKFGVFRLFDYNVDWSLPRRDSAGRKPKVILDPTLTIEQACRRRDVTMNAMAINLTSLIDSFENFYKQIVEEKELLLITDVLDIVDPYQGREAMYVYELRAVDPVLFLDDPLRFFRVMQFIGRFEMMPDPELQRVCASMDLRDPVTHESLARERIFEECKKLLLKSRRPSLGFRWLFHLGRLQELFPELHALVGVAQRPDYHPEGDVFEHTMQALDAAAQSDLYQDSEDGMTSEEEKFLIMLAVLCHDMGKPVTTDEQLRSYGHEEEGVAIARTFLKRITDDVFLIKAVTKLVKYHMAPFSLIRDHAHSKAYKRLALKLSPEVNMRQLALVARADHCGRNPENNEPLSNDFEELHEFISHAQKLEILYKPEAQILLGRHVSDIVEPGPKMGALLKEIYRIQIEEGIKDEQELKRRACLMADALLVRK